MQAGHNETLYTNSAMNKLFFMLTELIVLSHLTLENQSVSQKVYLEFGRGIAKISKKSLTVPKGIVILKFGQEHFIHFYFLDGPITQCLSESNCGSHKVYLNFWVTHFGGCDRVQIKVNISMFGWDCPSPYIY
jgi:hypothetical protein